MKPKFFLCLSILLGGVTLFSVSLPDVLLAQHDNHLVYTSCCGISSPSWSADGRFFVFGNDTIPSAVTSDTSSWLSYDSETKILSEGYDRWPLQPSLSNAQQNLIALGRHVDGNESFAFLSPSGQYLVYGTSQLPKNWSDENAAPLAVADLTDKNFISYETLVVNPFRAIDRILGFSVEWADDDSAFIASNYGSFGVSSVYYVTGYSSGVINGYEELYVIKVAGENYPVAYFYDISSDGNTILLNAQQGGADVVIFWNSQMGAKDRIIFDRNDNVFDASFSSTKQDVVLLLTQNSGLLEYDLVRGESTVLNPNLTYNAVFSPNGNQVAWFESDPTNPDVISVYIAPIEDLIQTPVP